MHPLTKVEKFLQIQEEKNLKATICSWMIYQTSCKERAQTRLQPFQKRQTQMMKTQRESMGVLNQLQEQKEKTHFLQDQIWSVSFSALCFL